MCHKKVLDTGKGIARVMRDFRGLAYGDERLE